MLQKKAPESRLTHQYLNWQTNGVSPNGHCTINGNLNSNSHLLAQPPAPPALFNRAPNIQEPFISSSESFKVGSHAPFPASTPLNICQHMHVNSAELIYKRSLPHTTKSAFEFPFSHSECKEHVQPSSFQSSSRSLPPWLLHATQHKETLITSHPYSHMTGRFHSCNLSGANFLTIPAVHHSSAVSFPYNSMTSHSHFQNSLGPTSLAHPPLIPVLPGSKPTVAINMSYKNRIKVKDRMRSKPFCFKDPARGKKTKKRPVARGDDPTKPTKISNLEMQEDSAAVTVLKARGNFSGGIQCYMGASEFDSNRDKASSAGCGPSEAQNEGLKSPSGIDSFKLDGVTRSGPMKLSAGAKHILKPSQNMDQDNSRPTHSTIPFAAVTDSIRVPESQKKSAKIYRF